MKPKYKAWTVPSRIDYSTSNSDSRSSNLSPIPILIIVDLDNRDYIISYRKFLKDKRGKTYYGYKLRHYSTCNKLQTLLNNDNRSSLLNLNPNYITGFSDAESTFVISVVKSKTNKIG